jgi:2-dehydropantoate 2-reductase
VNLTAEYAEIRIELAHDVSPDMNASMHHDLQAGKPLEVRWLSSGVVELGAQAGVPTPRSICDILALHKQPGS